jgi:hypothetical protein
MTQKKEGKNVKSCNKPVVWAGGKGKIIRLGDSVGGSGLIKYAARLKMWQLKWNYIFLYITVGAEINQPNYIMQFQAFSSHWNSQKSSQIPAA